MEKLIESVGGRKMFVFLLIFFAVTILFLFKYDVVKYSIAISPFVTLLVIGNVSVHKINQKGNLELQNKE